MSVRSRWMRQAAPRLYPAAQIAPLPLRLIPCYFRACSKYLLNSEFFKIKQHQVINMLTSL